MYIDVFWTKTFLSKCQHILCFFLLLSPWRGLQSPLLTYFALSLKEEIVCFEDLRWRGRCCAAKHEMWACVWEWQGGRVRRLVCLCECMCGRVCVCLGGCCWGGGWLPVGPASQCNWKMWPGKCLPSGAWKLPPQRRWRAQRQLTWPLTGRAPYWVGAHVKSHFIPSPHAEKCII